MASQLQEMAKSLRCADDVKMNSVESSINLIKLHPLNIALLIVHKENDVSQNYINVYIQIKAGNNGVIFQAPLIILVE